MVASASLNLEQGVVKLISPRNHPRLNLTPYLLLRGYRANLDLTPIIAAEATPLPVDEITEDSDRQVEILRLRKNRTCFGKDTQLTNVINYLLSYACKGEITRNDAFEMFKRIIMDVSDETSLVSAACKYTLQLLGSRTIPATECDYQLQGFPYYLCSKVPKPIFLNNTRAMKSTEDLLRLDPLSSVEKRNYWDLFLDRERNDFQTFSSFVIAKLNDSTSKKKSFPVFKGINHNDLFPMQEGTARLMLLIHKTFLFHTSDIYTLKFMT